MISPRSPQSRLFSRGLLAFHRERHMVSKTIAFLKTSLISRSRCSDRFSVLISQKNTGIKKKEKKDFYDVLAGAVIL